MDLKGKKVILASNSPRRHELLKGLDIAFEVDTRNNFEESFITSDTMVLLDGIIMGKPHSREEAEDMLRTLSGRTHEVITAVTIRDRSRMETVTDSTLVHFRSLSEEEISYYLDKYRPYDKAGAYGVQEWIGYVAITGIEGSFYNVMGFPVHKVYEELIKFAG